MGYFFYLPRIEQLTEEQQLALDEINPIAISGGAGTGKTVVSLWRHLQIMESREEFSVLVAYTKTLRFYLEQTTKSVENRELFISKNLLPPSEQIFNLKNFPYDEKWCVKEIIIDEAQDLPYDIHKKIINHAEQVSYGADFNQQLYSNRITESEIKNLYFNNIKYDLQQNFRNTFQILNFVKHILPDFYIPQSIIDELEYEREGFKPKLFVTENFNLEIEKIIEIINEFQSDTHNIAILLPFGDDRSDYSQSVDKYYEALKNKGIQCSKYYNAMKTDNIYIDNIHITTFKSAKGLEFDTVIIPNFDKIHSNIKNFYTVGESDYYVAFTRAKKNLYLFASKKLDFINDDFCEIVLLENSINTFTSPSIDIDNEGIPF